MTNFEVVCFEPELDSLHWQEGYRLIRDEIHNGKMLNFQAQTQVLEKQGVTVYGVVPEHRESLIAVGILGAEMVRGYREVAYLATEADSRKQGYGGHLLQILERVAEQDGATGTFLMPMAAAISFYRDHHDYREWNGAPQHLGSVWRKRFKR